MKKKYVDNLPMSYTKYTIDLISALNSISSFGPHFTFTSLSSFTASPMASSSISTRQFSILPIVVAHWQRVLKQQQCSSSLSLSRLVCFMHSYFNVLFQISEYELLICFRIWIAFLMNIRNVCHFSPLVICLVFRLIPCWCWLF